MIKCMNDHQSPGGLGDREKTPEAWVCMCKNAPWKGEIHMHICLRKGVVAEPQDTQARGQPLKALKWQGRPSSSGLLASFQDCLCWALQGVGVETLTPVPSLAMTDGIDLVRQPSFILQLYHLEHVISRGSLQEKRVSEGSTE